MPLPRENVPIGALWNLSLGPMGNGVSQELLNVTQSFNDISSNIENQFSSSLNLTLLKYIGGKSSFDATSKAEYKIENVSIVSLNSPDILKNSVGQVLLYEAIKINKISISLDKTKEFEVKADLQKIFKQVDIEHETDINNRKNITISGVNLYIAYRLVKIENARTETKKLKFSSQGHTTISYTNLSSVYLANTREVSVQVCPCSISKCMGETNKSLTMCATENGYDFTVILKNRINMTNGTPETLTFKIYATETIQNKYKSLYLIQTSEGIEASYLNIEKMIFAPLTGTFLYMLSDKASRKANIITTKFTFSNFTPTSVPGWKL
jgi:hypothetical protein